MTIASAPERTRRQSAARAPARQPRQLHLVRPAQKRSSRVTSRLIWIGPALVLAALLAVAGAQTMLAEGQVSLARVQSQITTAQIQRLDDELALAREEQPSAIVGDAARQGMVVPRSITDLAPVDPGATTSKAASSAPEGLSGHPGRKKTAGTGGSQGSADSAASGSR